MCQRDQISESTADFLRVEGFQRGDCLDTLKEFERS